MDIKKLMEPIQKAIDNIMTSQDFKDNALKSIDKVKKNDPDAKYFTLRLVAKELEHGLTRFSLYFDPIDIETLLPKVTEECWDFWPLIESINENIDMNAKLYRAIPVERVNGMNLLPSSDTEYDQPYITQGNYVTFYIWQHK